MTELKVRTAGALKGARAGTVGKTTGPSWLAASPAVGTTAQKWAALTPPTRGWFSGISSPYGGGDEKGVAFGTWRGDSIDFLNDYRDSENGTNWNVGVMSAANDGSSSGFTGWVDLAIGGPSNWADAAAGSLDDALRAGLTRFRANRIVGGTLRPTSIRPAHEFNLTNYPWQLHPGNEPNYLATMRRWRAIQNEVFPEAFWAMVSNGDPNNGINLNLIWGEPGEDLWDLYGADLYNLWPYVGTAYDGTFTSWSDYALRNEGTGQPRGAEAHRQFAESKGVPFYIPEFSNNCWANGYPAQAGNDPYWTNQIYAWIKTHRGTHAGGVIGESWFNISPGTYGDAYWIVDTAGNINQNHPNVALAYRDFFPVAN